MGEVEKAVVLPWAVVGIRRLIIFVLQDMETVAKSIVVPEAFHATPHVLVVVQYCELIDPAPMVLPDTML